MWAVAAGNGSGKGSHKWATNHTCACTRRQQQKAVHMKSRERLCNEVTLGAAPGHEFALLLLALDQRAFRGLQHLHQLHEIIYAPLIQQRTDFLSPPQCQTGFFHFLAYLTAQEHHSGRLTIIMGRLLGVLGLHHLQEYHIVRGVDPAVELLPIPAQSTLQHDRLLEKDDTQPPPPPQIGEEIPTNRQNKSADPFSPKQLATGLDLGCKPQTYLPFGCCAVMWKPKMSVNLKKKFHPSVCIGPLSTDMSEIASTLVVCMLVLHLQVAI